MSETRCPHCGRVITGRSHRHPWETGHRYADVAVSPSRQIVMETRRTSPAREPSPASDVLVPALQSVVTGLGAGLLAGLAAWYWRWDWYVPFLVAEAVMPMTWGVLLMDHRSLLRSVEVVSTPGDVVAVEDPATPTRATWNIQGEFRSPETGQVKRPEFPGQPRRLREFAQAVLAGLATFSYRGARRCEYGDTNFEALQQLFVAEGWAEWRGQDPRQGAAVSDSGVQVLNWLATTPLPSAR